MMSHADPICEPSLDACDYVVGQQVRFDPLSWEDNGYPDGAKQALARRALWQKALKKQGIETKAWVLPNQLREYKSFGVDDGRVRNVYYLTVKSVEASKMHILGIIIAIWAVWSIAGEIDTAHRNEMDRIKEDQDNG